jgi:hypothetical protein
VQLFISMDLETAMNACMLGLEVVHIPWWADASVKLKQRVRQQTNKHTAGMQGIPGVSGTTLFG